MITYKQEVKDRARRKLWSHAVQTITTKREQSKILNHDYVRNLWDYSFHENLIPFKITNEFNSDILNNWIDFSNSTYGNKKPGDIKVAYLCGPEPENDLNTLLELGVRLENVWAVEKKDKLYQEALSKAKEKFSNLKIFEGSLDDLIKIYRIPFDIIYLDFTAPIFSNDKKPFVTIHTIFEEQALSDLGVLVTNFSEPEQNTDTVNFLESYFLNHLFVEGSVVGAKTKTEEPINWFVEGPINYLGSDLRRLKEIIQADIKSVYSAFCSHYIVSYANIIAPAFRTIKNPSVRKKLYKHNDELHKNLTSIMRDTSVLFGTNGESNYSRLAGELVINSNEYPYWNFIEEISKRSDKISKYWKNIYTSREEGFSRYDAIKFRDLLRNYHVGQDFLSDVLKESIPTLDKVVKRTEGVFCDRPSPYLWIELAINQLGFPYHSQFNEHLRFSYTAQKNEMFVDCFVFDRCRSLYDWLPMIELYNKDLSVLERQILTRVCLDAIGGKQTGRILPELYYGSNLIGIYEKDWAEFIEGFPEREKLT